MHHDRRRVKRSPLRVMFVVQGEGRGHLTQAIAAKEILIQSGHTVSPVVVSTGMSRAIPDFFCKEFAGLHRILSFRFAYAQQRHIAWVRTYLWNALRLGRIVDGLLRLDRLMRESRPDVVVGFFEPLVGLHQLLFPPRAPALTIAHQYMIWHPSYPRLKRYSTQHFGLKLLAAAAGYGCARVALSLYQTAEGGFDRTIVCPPLMRSQVRNMRPNRGDFLLVYLLQRGYLEDIVRWHESHPEVLLHCFYDRSDSDDTAEDATLKLHGIDGDLFLSMMARCRGVACTGGFETVSEAAYLGKPLMMVPVPDYYEQHLNSLDAQRLGLGKQSERFDLDRLLSMQPVARVVRGWFDRTPEILLHAVESTAGRVRLHRRYADTGTGASR